jgi:hypothetical protein
MRHESKTPKAIADIDSDEILALANPVAEVVIGCSTVLQTTTLEEEEKPSW